MSFSEELDQMHFFLFSGFMLYFTYFYNKMTPRVLSMKMGLIFFNVPANILWYIAFVYNDFLCINPVPHEIFMSLLFMYVYATIYLLISFLKHYCD